MLSIRKYTVLQFFQQYNVMNTVNMNIDIDLYLSSLLLTFSKWSSRPKESQALPFIEPGYTNIHLVYLNRLLNMLI
jgi:hypothetical protein